MQKGDKVEIIFDEIPPGVTVHEQGKPRQREQHTVKGTVVATREDKTILAHIDDHDHALFGHNIVCDEEHYRAVTQKGAL